MDKEFNWQDQWPSGFGEPNPEELPKAVEFELEFEDVGKIRRLFRITPGSTIAN